MKSRSLIGTSESTDMIEYDRRCVNNKREYLIRWQSYKKVDSTYEKESELEKMVYHK